MKREATKTWPAGTKETTVKREHAEWLAEVEGRIEALRAARNGTGISLSKKGAAALAAQWYDWFTEKYEDEGAYAEHMREEVRDAFLDAVDEDDLRYRKEAQIWAQDEGVREAVRPVLASVCKTAQKVPFLVAELGVDVDPSLQLPNIRIGEKR